MSPGGSLLLLFYPQQGSGPPPATYATLLEAVVATLKDAMVTPGDLNGVYDRIPPTIRAPYAVVYTLPESADYMSPTGAGVDYIDEGSFQVSVFAEGRVVARDLGRAVEAALNDAALTFDDGTLMVLRRDWRNVEIDPDRSPAAKPLHHCSMQFSYECQRSL